MRSTEVVTLLQNKHFKWLFESEEAAEDNFMLVLHLLVDHQWWHGSALLCFDWGYSQERNWKWDVSFYCGTSSVGQMQRDVFNPTRSWKYTKTCSFWGHLCRKAFNWCLTLASAARGKGCVIPPWFAVTLNIDYNSVSAVSLKCDGSLLFRSKELMKTFLSVQPGTFSSPRQALR